MSERDVDELIARGRELRAVRFDSGDDRWDRWVAWLTYNGPDLLDAAERGREAERELADWAHHVTEWLCAACNTMYPGPPQSGVECVICPQCGGDTAPREVTLRRAAAKRCVDLEAGIETTQNMVRNAVGLLNECQHFSCRAEMTQTIDAKQHGFIIRLCDEHTQEYQAEARDAAEARCVELQSQVETLRRGLTAIARDEAPLTWMSHGAAWRQARARAALDGIDQGAGNG